MDDMNDIVFRLDKNFSRVDNLIKIYEDYLQGTGKGRRPALKTDILRSAVVLLHSTLEDFLRSIFILKGSSLSKDKLNQVPLAGVFFNGRPTKFFLGELIEHNHKSVGALIQESIEEYASLKSFNNTTDVSSVLTDCGYTINHAIQKSLSSLGELINRRHKIVHEADRDNRQGKGLHGYQSISVTKVKLWRNVVDKVCLEIIKQ